MTSSNNKITKLEKEVEELESAIYDAKNEKDLDTKYFLLQQRRDLAIRGAVLDIHLAIEDILSVAIKNYLLANNPQIQKKPAYTNSKHKHDIEDFLNGSRAISFNDKLSLLKSAGLIRANVCNELAKLNTIRNKCSHNWQLNKVIRRKVKRNKKKRPLLEYNGKNLYKKQIFYEFLNKYGPIYYKLWLKFS